MAINYVVTAVRTKQKIEYLRVHDYSGNIKGPAMIWDRQKVIEYY